MFIRLWPLGKYCHTIFALVFLSELFGQPGIIGCKERVFAEPITQAKISSLPAMEGPVTRIGHYLSTDEFQSITDAILYWQSKTGAQMAILILPSTQPYSIEEYSLAVAESWQLGRDGIDDGLLVVAAIHDRKVRIEVGYGLEGSIPDIIAKQTIDHIIVPKFRNGDYGTGLINAIDFLGKRIQADNKQSPMEWLEDYNRRQMEKAQWEMRLRMYYIYFIYGMMFLSLIFGIFAVRSKRHILGYLGPSLLLVCIFLFAELYVDSYFRDGYIAGFLWLIVYSVLVFIAQFLRNPPTDSQVHYVSSYGSRGSGASGRNSRSSAPYSTNRSYGSSRSSSSSGSSYNSSRSSSGSSTSRSSSSGSSSYSGGGGKFGGGGASGGW